MEYTFVELKQKHLEDFIVEVPKETDIPFVVYNGRVLRAAVKAGWIPEIKKVEEVDGMQPGDVTEIAKAILDKYIEVTKVSPE